MSYTSTLTVGDFKINFNSDETCCDAENQEKIASLARDYPWVWKILGKHMQGWLQSFNEDMETVQKYYPQTTSEDLVKRIKKPCYCTFRFHKDLIQGLMDEEIEFSLTTSGGV